MLIEQSFNLVQLALSNAVAAKSADTLRQVRTLPIRNNIINYNNATSGFNVAHQPNLGLIEAHYNSALPVSSTGQGAQVFMAGNIGFLTELKVIRGT